MTTTTTIMVGTVVTMAAVMAQDQGPSGGDKGMVSEKMTGIVKTKAPLEETREWFQKK